MTLIPASAADCSWLDRAVPSIAATISSFSFLVIIWSICCDCVGMSSFAYCRSTLYPFSSSCFLTLLPSAIQRSEVWVGMATPTVTSLGLSLPPEPEPEPPPAPLPPQATRPSARAAPTALNLSFLLTCSSPLRDHCRRWGAQARHLASETV